MDDNLVILERLIVRRGCWGSWEFWMVIGSLVEEKDALEAIEEKDKKKNKEENTSKKIRLWYHVEVERGLLRNDDFPFPLIKNEYIYTKHET